MTTAVAYVRISSDVEDQRLGVTRQREDVAALARRLGAELVRVFEDNDVSAFTERGPETAWAQLLEFIRGERPDYVLAYRMDRFGRRMGDIERLDDLCRKVGAKVWSVTEGDLFANILWTFQAAQAKAESRNTSERVRRAFEAKRARGIQPQGGKRPFGYRKDRVTIVPEEARVIQDITQRILAGESTSRIVRWLNETGVPTVTGARWSSTAVRGILTNPRYVGDLTQGKDRRVIGRGAWRPILKRGDFETLQVVLEKRKAYNAGRPPTASLLGGIVRCGRCLSPMTAHSSGRASKPYRSYGCHRSAGGCGRVVRKQALVDEYVVAELLSRIDVESLVADREAAAAEVKRVQSVERDLSWRLDAARTAIQEDRLALESGLPILDNLRRQRETARRALAAARNRLSEAERSTAAQERWDTWSLEQKRDWIRSHTSAILVHPTGPGRRDPGVEVRLR